MKLLFKFLPILGLLLCASPAWSACTNTALGTWGTCVQLNATNCDGALTCNVLMTATASGHVLVAYIQYVTSGNSFACSSGMTTTGGTATWATAATNVGAGFAVTNVICYTVNPSSGITSALMTVTGSASSVTNAYIVELAGISTTSTVDIARGNYSPATSTANYSFGPSATTAFANEYVVCGLAHNSTTAGSATGGFTIQASDANLHSNYLDQPLSSTGTITCSGTLGGSVAEIDGVVVSFKATTQPATMPLGSKIAGPSKVAGPTVTD